MPLKRDVGEFSLIVYGIGIILGAGIYSLMGQAAGMAGNTIWLSFLFASVVSIFTCLSYAELSSMFPKSAAEYTYIKEALNKRSIAFMFGWIEVFADVVAGAAVAIAFGGYFHALFGVPMVVSSIGLVALLSFLNYWSIRESSRVNIICTLVEVAGLVLIVALGLPHIGKIDYFEMPNGVTGVISASALIFFAYLGFEEMANIAEETKNPRKTLPRALLISVAVTSVIYILVAITAVGLVDWRALAGSNAPLAFVASQSVLGQNAFLLLSFIALFATSNTVLTSMITTSRALYGMAKDGSLPKSLSRIDGKRGTPWLSVILTMLATFAFILVGDLKITASITDFGAFALFIIVNLSLLFLRYTKPKLNRPFKAPLNIGKFSVTAFLGLVTCSLMMFHLEKMTILYGLALTAVGVPLYYLYKKRT